MTSHEGDGETEADDEAQPQVEETDDERASDEQADALPVDPALESSLSAPWALPQAFALALIVRLGAVALLQRSPLASRAAGMSHAYDLWAQRIARGRFGDGAFFFDPLYAFVIAPLYRVGHHSLTLPRLVNVLAGCAAVVLASRAAWHLWRSRAATVLSAVAMALCVPAVAAEASVTPTALALALAALGVERLLAGDDRAVKVSGAALGFAALAHGALAWLVPAAALALWRGWDPHAARAALTPDARVKRAGWLLACALPAAILGAGHDLRAGRTAFPMTPGVAARAYVGNHSGNDTGARVNPAFAQPDPARWPDEFRTEGERRAGQPLSDAGLSRRWFRETFDAAKREPVTALSRVYRRARLTLHDDAIPEAEGATFLAPWVPLYRSPLFGYGLLVPLAILGFVVGRRRRGVALVAGGVGVVALPGLLTYVDGAQRALLAPGLAALAGGGACWLVSAWRSGAREELYRGLGVVAAGMLLSFQTPDWLDAQRDAVTARGFAELGASLRTQGKTEAAMTAFEHAIEADATASPGAVRALELLYRESADWTRAETHLRRVLERRPSSPGVRGALVRVYDAMLATPRYSDDAEVRRRRELLAAGGVEPEPTAEPSTAEPTPSPSPTTADAGPTIPSELSASARQAMATRLRDEPAGSATWIIFDTRDPNAEALARQIADVFREARWTVRSIGPAPFALRPGVRLLAADDPASELAGAVGSALNRAGLNATFGVGYRAFSEERQRADPNWRGISFERDQGFVIAVGRGAQ
ncbi:MAG: hypothetical protein R3A52_23005 [Polyangiales bacterium]